MGSDYRGFYETFAGFYDALREERPGETDFYVEQARRCGGAVLEVGCGTGHVLLPVASSGSEVWGIDSSEAMLRVLEGKLERLARRTGERLRVTLRREDMRDFALGRRFGLVMIPFHTFQHLMDPEEQRGCLRCVRRHLTPEGRLVMDVAGFDPDSLPRRQVPIRLETHGTLRHPDMAGELETRFSVEMDPTTGRAIQTRSLRRGAEELVRASVEVKYLRSGELDAALEAAGFRVLRRLGGFAGEPFAPGGEQVWIAEPDGGRALTTGTRGSAD